MTLYKNCQILYDVQNMKLEEMIGLLKNNNICIKYQAGSLFNVLFVQLID